MAQVYHKYVRAGEKIPEPAKEQRDRDESDAKFSAARARKEEALADLREAEWKRRSGALDDRDVVILPLFKARGCVRLERSIHTRRG
jgi:hypothetical protein